MNNRTIKIVLALGLLSVAAGIGLLYVALSGVNGDIYELFPVLKDYINLQ